MLGRRRKRRVVGGERFGVAAELEQSDAAIELRHRMTGRERERRIE